MKKWDLSIQQICLLMMINSAVYTYVKKFNAGLIYGLVFTDLLVSGLLIKDILKNFKTRNIIITMILIVLLFAMNSNVFTLYLEIAPGI